MEVVNAKLEFLHYCSSLKPMAVRTYAIRLEPGDDLKNGIERMVKDQQVQAGWIFTAVGSLINYQLRMANQSKASSGEGHFEIVSLVGTLSLEGCHLHLCISDHTGLTIGGHLLSGCVIYTTAEIVIGVDDQYVFTREMDNKTGFKEIVITDTKKNKD